MCHHPLQTFFWMYLNGVDSDGGNGDDCSDQISLIYIILISYYIFTDKIPITKSLLCSVVVTSSALNFPLFHNYRQLIVSDINDIIFRYKVYLITLKTYLIIVLLSFGEFLSLKWYFVIRRTWSSVLFFFIIYEYLSADSVHINMRYIKCFNWC